MNNEKIFPCPLCGEKAVIDREDIFCDACHLYIKINDFIYSYDASTYEEAREQAIETWNTRKPMERTVKQLEELFKHHNATKTVKRLVLEAVRGEIENV